jgi:MOSC domain-containing protein YiiM
VVSVNASSVRVAHHRDRDVATGIYKEPVSGRRATHGVNLDGDDQADRRAHGGPERALYAYAAEDLRWWENDLGRPLAPGSMGENLTLEGIDVTGALIGEQWRAGTILAAVTAPRIPCFKLSMRMNDPRFQQRFAAARRPGAYLRIIEHGDVAAGDPVAVLARPDHDVTVALVAAAYHDDHRLAARLLDAADLGVEWRAWAEQHA